MLINQFKIGDNYPDTGGNPLKVNKAISFNVIKNKAIELLYDTEISSDELLAQMANLFEQRPKL